MFWTKQFNAFVVYSCRFSQHWFLNVWPFIFVSTTGKTSSISCLQNKISKCVMTLKECALTKISLLNINPGTLISLKLGPNQSLELNNDLFLKKLQYMEIIGLFLFYHIRQAWCSIQVNSILRTILLRVALAGNTE